MAKLFLIQLRIEGEPPVLVDPLAIEDLSPLGTALARCEVLVHGGDRDIELLQRHAGLEPGLLLDTQVLAGLAGLGHPRRLQDLVHEVLGAQTVSTAGLSDWSRRPLAPAQLRYAAEDVAVLHDLATALGERAGPERRVWAQEESSERIGLATAAVDPLRAWRRLGAAWVLDTRQREQLCHIAAWREHQAAERNLKPWNIASDTVLIDVVRRNPQSVVELANNRLMPRGLVKRHGERLVELLREAPERLLAPLVDDPRTRSKAALLQAWAHGVEVRKGLAASLVLPPRLLEQALHNHTAFDAGSWRDRALGAEFRSLLDGVLPLVLDEATGANPTFSANS